MHHVRTLKIMLHVYARELKENLQMDPGRLECLFPRLENLLELHARFLSRLKERQRQSLSSPSDRNYTICSVADILIEQVGGRVSPSRRGSGAAARLGRDDPCAPEVLRGNGREDEGLLRRLLQPPHGGRWLLQRPETEQQEVPQRHQSEKRPHPHPHPHPACMLNTSKPASAPQKINNLPIVRRLGVTECILLVTQRITKYPVLVERILNNTEGPAFPPPPLEIIHPYCGMPELIFGSSHPQLGQRSTRT